MEIQGITEALPVVNQLRVGVTRKQESTEEAVPHPKERAPVSSTIRSHRPHLQVDERDGQVIAHIIDDEGVVVKQIPAEELRQAALRSEQVRVQLFDESV